jgi:hypothetical protein
MSTVKKFSIGGAVGIAIGLIGTGIQWRWPEQKGIGAGLIGLGLLVLIIAFVAALVRNLTIKEYERQHASAPTGAPVPNRSQEMSQTGIDFKPHIEVNPVFSQTQEKPSKQTHVFPTVLPELECVGFGVVDGLLDGNGRLVDDLELIDEDGFRGSCRVAQVEFHLKPLVDSDPWVEMRTQITFWDDSDDPQRLKRVRDGVWREHGNVIQMPINCGDTRTLVIALQFSDAGITTYEYRERTRDYGLRTSYLAPIEEPLNKDAVLVHVRLIGKYLSRLRLDQEMWFRLIRAESKQLAIGQVKPLLNLYPPS